MGLHRAGFDVTGVDLVSHDEYPFKFIQCDALTVDLRGFDFVWASPPCQSYSACARFRPQLESVPRLIDQIRSRLMANGAPWIIENVQGADLRRGSVMLCGTMFGLKVFRHRFFESSLMLFVPEHHRHNGTVGKSASGSDYGRGRNGFVCVAGHAFSREMGSEAMGIDWMTRGQLAEAIPPAYSEHLGRQVIEHLERTTVQA